MRIIELLNWSANHLKNHGIDQARLEAELLLGHSLGMEREKLYIHLNELIDGCVHEKFREMLERRIKGEPIQYILGHKEFWSLDIKVKPGVFIPRPETELLVEQALSIFNRERPREHLWILEIGTGTGAIAIALAKELKNVSIIATDISRDAVSIAKENATSAGVNEKILFIISDLFRPFHFSDGGYFDMILSNPPYIKRSDLERLPKEVKDYEPREALDGGEDGLDFYRKIIDQSPLYIKDGGWLLLEIGQGQVDLILELLKDKRSFAKIKVFKDLSGMERVIQLKKVQLTE